MNLENGDNKKHLKADVLYGTKAHFLVHKDDKDIEHPLARILSKKYTGTTRDGTEHSIYRRDDRTYGASNSAFEHTIDKKNEEEHPMHPDVKTYYLHKGLYNNSNSNKVINHDWYKRHINDEGLSGEDVNNAAKHPDKEVALAAIKHEYADKVTTCRAAENPNKEVALEALRHKDADEYTTRIAARHPNKDVALAALKHKKVDKYTTWNAAEHPDKEVVLAALKHGYSNSDTTWNAAKHPDKEVALAALKHEHADEVTNRIAARHPDEEVRATVLKSTN